VKVKLGGRGADSQMPTEPQTFSVLRGEADGYPVVAIISSRLSDHKVKTDTPWFLGFSTRLSSPTPDGLPTPKDTDDLNSWEDIIDREINLRCKCIFVGRVTWKGSRELLYYVDKPELVIPEIQKLLDSDGLRLFAFRYEHDPHWANVSVYA
jgi:hypothetical protein